MHCQNCGSIEMKGGGVRMMGNKRMLKYTCKTCGEVHYTDTSVAKPVYGKSYVVTSATDSFPINKRFLAVLKKYCEHNGATLVVIPVNNRTNFNESNYDDELVPYLISTNIQLGDDTMIMGATRLGTTLDSPLHGMNQFSKGKSVVFGHPQLQLKTLTRKNEKYPPIMMTTGSVSIPNYTENKSAQKAKFNHAYSALFVSADTPRHFRHLNFDGKGFYDLSKYYTETEVIEENKISAIITGDEHVVFHDKEVFAATYGKGGIVDTLKPDYIVRHDVLDCYSISHHHKGNVFVKYGKRISETDSIENELKQTLKFIEDTTPSTSKSIIVPSNHNSHLLRWLNEADPKNDPVNAKIYHQLMYLMYDNLVVVDGLAKYPDPFELYSRGKVKNNVSFLKPDDDFMLHDIDLNNHGDVGLNGTRGTRQQYKDLPNKSVIGHSHSPGIEKGAYQVGTSSRLRLEYNHGLSSWHHCHCLVYPNGRRQLLFIVDGKWK